jgi:hypothetical protein
MAVTVLASDIAPVQAAPPAFCEEYAHAAITQVRIAYEHRRSCEPGLDHPRWTNNWRTHYDWCLGVPRSEADREREIRQNHLRACAR